MPSPTPPRHIVAACSYCNSTILFGGRKQGELRFCNDTCLSKGQRLTMAMQLAPEVVAPAVTTVHTGPCPVCKGPGPVDVFTAYTIYSAIIVTTWKNEPRLSCRGCATKRQTEALLQSALLGWWGFPHGLLRTPIQIARNIGGLRQRIATGQPSRALEQMVRLSLVANGSVATAPRADDLTSLRAALSAPDPKVREQAASALGDLGAAARDALSDLGRLCRDPNRAVQARASWAVETIQRKLSQRS